MHPNNAAGLSSQPLLSLVSGLPLWERGRLFAMLQAAIDESEVHKGRLTGQLFVMTGYVSTIERWDAFSIAWSHAMAAYNNGQPFSMVDAARDWSEELQRERLGYLQSLIGDHAEFGVRVSCNPSMLAAYMDGVQDERFKDPHYFCLWILITHLMQFGDDLIQGRKVDFIFDRGRSRPVDVQRHWDAIVEAAPGRIREQLPNDPQFRANSEFIPLQAADMISWWQRRRIEEGYLGLAKKSRSKIGLHLPLKYWHIDERFLADWRELNILGAPVPYEGPDGIGFIFPGGEKVLFARTLAA